MTQRIRVKRWMVAVLDEDGHVTDGDWFITDDFKLGLLAVKDCPGGELVKVRLDYKLD